MINDHPRGSFNWIIWGTFAVVLMAIVAMILLLRSSSHAIVRANAQVTRTNAVLETLDNLRDADARTQPIVKSGVTSRTDVTPTVVTAVHQNHAEELHLIDHLHDLTSDDATEQRRADHLHKLVSDSDAHESTASVQEHGSTLLHDIARSSGNEHEQVTALVRAISRAERQLLAQRQAEVTAASSRTDQNLYALLVVCLLAALGATIAVKRDREARLHAAQAERVARARMMEAVTGLEARNRRISLLNSLASALQICASPADVHNTAVTFITNACHPLGGAIALIADSRVQIERTSLWGEADLPDFFAPDECCALRAGSLHFVTHENGVLRCQHTQADGYACIPLAAQGETIGIVHVHFNAAQQDAVSEFISELAPPMSSALATTLANLRLREVLRNQSIRDPLTGLFNRRYLEETLGRELRRADRRGVQLAVLMIDVDHFKKFNDRHGHEAGDAVLQEVGQSLRNTFRAEDVACRYGGEEFALVLMDVDAQAAGRIAVELLARIHQLRPRLGKVELPHVTVSGGMALSGPGDGANIQRLIRLADERLYRAKQAGRNCIVTESEIVTEADRGVRLTNEARQVAAE